MDKNFLELNALLKIICLESHWFSKNISHKLSEVFMITTLSDYIKHFLPGPYSYGSER